MSGYDYRSLDNVIHSRVRLAIMSYLMTAKSAEFNDLKSALNVSDGNLSTHLTKLEQMDYVQIEKRFEDKKPVTTISLSKLGEKSFRAYIDELTNLIGTP